LARIVAIASALMAIASFDSGAALSATSQAPAAEASGKEYALGPGDRLKLSLYGDDTFNGEFTISDQGTVSLPLIGTQMAGGMSLEAFRAATQAKLADGYYRNPRLSAEVVNFRPFYILGEVTKPGSYPYVAGMTLGQAVAIAGGYTVAAKRNLVAIKHMGSPQEVKERADGALRIEPGDTVRILERLF